jgi:hypothetical protein
MESHIRGQYTVKSLIMLVLWIVSFLILGVGCRGPAPTQTPTLVPVALGETPSITLAPPGPVIGVQPGEPLAIAAHVAGIEPQVTWTATCRMDKNCEVLQNTTGPDNFFTAPDTPGEQITIRATVKDKYGRENSATLAFKVEEPTPTPTPSPTTTPTPTATAASTTTPTSTRAPTLAGNIVVSVIHCTDNGPGGTEIIRLEPPRNVARIHIDMTKQAFESGDQLFGVSLWEAEAYGPDTGDTNLVLGGQAIASSEQDNENCQGCSADKAIDGDMHTRWGSDFDVPQWLEITPPEPQVVDRIVLKWEAAYAKEYCVTVAEQVTPTPEPICQSTRPPLGGTPVDVEVEITSPNHCDTGLTTSMTAGGTYSGDLTGKEIWILVYPTTDKKYYPQSLDACAQIPSDASGGLWETSVNFGGPPQQYDVVAVVTEADGEASQEFKGWLQRGCETNDFPGYLRRELPGGITEVDAITVSTDEELTSTPIPTPTEIPVTDTPSPTHTLSPSSFQNFERNNGTPLEGNGEKESDYFWDAWFMDCSFSEDIVYEGQRAMSCRAFAHEKGSPNDTGGTVGIKPSSNEPIDLSLATTFYVWVYDTQGSNTVELKLCDDNGCPSNIWSEQKAFQNQWTRITWPVSVFTGIDRSRIRYIEIYEWNDGTYYFDTIGWE